MKLGLMQPYFFPYIGYWQLMKYCDYWIVFDTVQYRKGGWINRNQILHPNKASGLYITVPIFNHSLKTKINDVKIDNSKPYIEKILGQLTATYKKKAPNFKRIFTLVKDCLESERNDLAKLNLYAMYAVLDYLGISLKIELYSKMPLSHDPAIGQENWALDISKAVKATEYINAPGGVNLYDKEKFACNEIRLKFIKPNFINYNQRNDIFIPQLSIIDIMMFNSREAITEMLESYTFL